MEITIILARFWGGLFMLLGALSIGAKFLKRVINYTEDKTVTVSTGYITMLLGLITVVLHNVWVWDWPVVITILGWVTLIKGIEKIGFPDRVNKKAQIFKNQSVIWGVVIFLIGVFIFTLSLVGSLNNSNNESALTNPTPLPTTEQENELWQQATDTNTGITFKYPKTLLTEYIHTVDWPPQVQVLNEPFNCTEAGRETDRAGETKQRLVDDRPYCVTKVSEGAAGSIYTSYAYAFPMYSTGSTQADRKTIILTFSLRAVQCVNYPEPQMTACANERSSFDLDSTIDRIARSIVFNK